MAFLKERFCICGLYVRKVLSELGTVVQLWTYNLRYKGCPYRVPPLWQAVPPLRTNRNLYFWVYLCLSLPSVSLSLPISVSFTHSILPLTFSLPLSKRTLFAGWLICPAAGAQRWCSLAGLSGALSPRLWSRSGPRSFNISHRLHSQFTPEIAPLSCKCPWIAALLSIGSLDKHWFNESRRSWNNLTKCMGFANVDYHCCSIPMVRSS